ncbi:MAG: transposase [Paracoccus hibiscisoli]|uniref:transposase n=1 Tax=Paracoccus hibiscisoli TaxID=2023261 RepID=UPI00391B0970
MLMKTGHPSRFASSKRVGLTLACKQSGDRDIFGGITKTGDVTLRRVLCRAATVMMHEDGFPDAWRPLDMAETMGSAGRAPQRRGTGHGGPCPAHQRDPAPDSN